MTRTVDIRHASLYIDGQPRIVLCASLFPFRVPRDQWANRLDAVLQLGYICIDVYVPWNYHETRPGDFDFSGERDISHFLSLAHEAGLLVLARPGPYICSEYDGGGIPAWLGTVPGLELRQNEPQYLQHVRAWFDQILPILHSHEVSAGGAVALVQLENELDFFACDDPAGYIGALRDMAIDHGISVPLIACAGQGDLERATGSAEHIIPAVNLYPDDASPHVEDIANYYTSHLRQQNLPLMVTETNRLHRTLKRLLVGGAKLLGPYLQTSSWNFDFTTATNNWGQPLAFMTSDYDFGGAVAPDGTERPDAVNARLLALLINSLGPRLGAAAPGNAPHYRAPSTASPIVRSLDLNGGGQLISVTNLDLDPVRLSIEVSGRSLDGQVDGGACSLWISGLPLTDLGFSGSISAVSAELVALEATVNGTRIAFHTSDVAAIEVHVRGGRVINRGNSTLTIDHTVKDCIHIAGPFGGATIVDADGKHLHVQIIETTEAARLAADVFASRSEAPQSLHGETHVDHLLVSPDPVRYDTIATPSATIESEPEHMERHGIYQGSALYSSIVPSGPARALLLDEAADVVSVTFRGRTSPMTASGGGALVISLDGPDDPSAPAPIQIKADIWGHSNFHDERMPSLKLGSLRGISGAAVIHEEFSLDDGWYVSSPDPSITIGSMPAPRSIWGGWSTSVRPETVRYSRTLKISEESDTAALRIEGTETTHDVWIDATRVGMITPLSPVLNITRALTDKKTVTLSITTTRHFSEQTGSISLLTGSALRDWSVVPIGLSELTVSAGSTLRYAISTTMPLTVMPGEPRWAYLDVGAEIGVDTFSSDVIVRLQGVGVKLTILSNDRIIGRIWTEALAGMALKGGRGDVALIPAPWATKNPMISILIEAVGPAPGVVHGVTLSDQIDKD